MNQIVKQEPKLESLGVIVPNVSKTSKVSYDLSGTIDVLGTRYIFGAYKQISKGNNKLPKGAEFYSVHRVTKAEKQKDMDATQESILTKVSSHLEF